jgi:hypothetical protein
MYMTYVNGSFHCRILEHMEGKEQPIIQQHYTIARLVKRRFIADFSSLIHRTKEDPHPFIPIVTNSL